MFSSIEIYSTPSSRKSPNEKMRIKQNWAFIQSPEEEDTRRLSTSSGLESVDQTALAFQRVEDNF